MALVSIHAYISGRVQGVNYRYSTAMEATQLGLTGWVRNLHDGRVEALFEGEEETVKQMLDWCQQGPPMARVTKEKRLNKRIQEILKIFRFGLKIISLVLLIMLGIPCVLAQQPQLDTTFVPPLQAPSPGNVLQGTIVESKYLPPEIYGTWQVISTLISTNAPYAFKPKTSDIWILRQIGDKVVLLNPDTGAKSFVTVQAVKNNTATFSCQTINRNRIDTEHPTITVSGNNFVGKNLYTVQYIQNNQVVHYEQGFFEITATRLSGPTPGIFSKERSK